MKNAIRKRTEIMEQNFKYIIKKIRVFLEILYRYYLHDKVMQ